MNAQAASRIGLAAVAVSAIVWLALGLGSTNALQRAERVRDLAGERGVLGDRELSRARNELERARRYAPDVDAALLEATLLARAGRAADAAPLLERLVADEPKNIEAWYLLVFATHKTDPARSAEATRRGRALSPLLDAR